MKRLAVALAAGAAVSSLAFASASVLKVDGGTIQAGQDTTLSCDANGVKVNWGLETDSNTVSGVRIEGIAERCTGAEMFVSVNGGATQKMVIADDEVKISFPSAMTPESINDIKIWIEG